MEGMTCLVCGTSQDRGVTVFPLPRSSHQGGAWQAALPDITVQNYWSACSQQYGVCEKHFNPKDIKRGRKPSLTHKAVPLCPHSINLEKKNENTSSSSTHQITEGCGWQGPENLTSTSDTSLVDPLRTFQPQGSPSYPVNDEAVGVPKPFTEECVCLVCGKDRNSCHLVGLVSGSPQAGKVPVSVQLARLMGRARREVLCVSAMICSRCEALVQEVTQVEEDLKIKKQTIKDMFEATLQSHKEKVKVSNDTPAAMHEAPDDFSLVQNTTPLALDSTLPEKNDNDNTLSVEAKEFEGTRKTNRRKASAKKYCCPHCQEVYTSLALWVHHLSKHSNTEEPAVSGKIRLVANKARKKQKVGSLHTCEECGSTFLGKQSLAAHMTTHQKSWDCSVCGRYLTTKARLKAHLLKFHAIGEEKNKEVACQECGKCFGTKAGLRYHRNVVHHVGVEYQCQHCPKVFHYHVPYRSHLLYAHGEKKVVCETCGEKFFTISKLNTHINAVHRSAQSWSCEECQTKFTTQTAYRHHINVKHLKVHHSCNYCGTHFRKKSSLLQHLWKHSVYICQVCQQNFPSREDLRSHAATVHGRELGWRSRRKHGSTSSQNKKLAGGEDATLQKAVVATPPEQQQLQQNEHVASMINDLLMTAETYGSSSLQPFSLAPCDKLSEKVTYPGHDQLKIKGLGMIEAPQGLDAAQFGSMEEKAHSPDHMEMAPGVSLINVQILGDMEISQSDTLGDLKGSILDPEDTPHHHLSVASELEAAHPLEASEDHLEVTSLDTAVDHLNSTTSIQVPDTLEETRDLTLDPHHQCALPAIGTSTDVDSGQLVGGEAKEHEGSLHKEIDQVEPVDLEPFPVTLGGKGEVQYQYVMYISAPGEDSSPG